MDHSYGGGMDRGDWAGERSDRCGSAGGTSGSLLSFSEKEGGARMLLSDQSVNRHTPVILLPLLLLY